jgi:hypothetical protein
MGKKRLKLVLVSVTLRSPGAPMQPVQQSASICLELACWTKLDPRLGRRAAIPISPPAAFAPALA